jgi:hypothetical protein
MLSRLDVHLPPISRDTLNSISLGNASASFIILFIGAASTSLVAGPPSIGFRSTLSLTSLPAADSEAVRLARNVLETLTVASRAEDFTNEFVRLEMYRRGLHDTPALARLVKRSPNELLCGTYCLILFYPNLLFQVSPDTL